MSDGFMLYLDDDGVARHYDDTYDITIHCESEEEMQRAIEQLKSLQWIPCSESRPKHGVVLVTYKDGEIDLLHFPTAYRAKDIIAWMPLPEPYKEDEHE